MEASGSPGRPSSKEPKFSVPFKNPTLQWASRRMICQLPGHQQADAKKDHPMPPLPPPPPSDQHKALVRVKPPSGGKKLDRGQVPADTAWKKGGAAPDGLNLRSKGTSNGASRVAKAVGFSLRLTQDEIVEDFIAMTGKKPPARPKKPPKNARKYLEDIFPGSMLPNDIDAKRYEAEGDPVPQ